LFFPEHTNSADFPNYFSVKDSPAIQSIEAEVSRYIPVHGVVDTCHESARSPARRVP